MQDSTLCYKDGPQLPPLNFTSICTESAKYVIFYNERLDDVSYPNDYEVTNVFTELCEVTVKGKTEWKVKKLHQHIKRQTQNVLDCYSFYYFKMNSTIQNVQLFLNFKRVLSSRLTDCLVVFCSRKCSLDTCC